MLPSWLTSWIAAYLSNRRQRVKHNGKFTEWNEVRAGVIQGSVLGPILFLLFISDINSYLPKEINLIKYADDILVYILGTFNNNLPQLIVNGIQAWCTENGMRLNITKCKILAIGHNCEQPLVVPNNIPLEYIISYKYLGIQINTRLDPNQQWQRVYSLTNSLTYLLKKLKCNGWTKSMLLNAYRAYGLSHFTYSAAIIRACNNSDKAEMTRYQNRILKTIGVSNTEAEVQHGILPILTHINKICASTFDRIINNPAHPITASLLVNPRKPGHYIVPTYRTAAYRESFIVNQLLKRRDGRDNLYTNTSTHEIV
jgi:hypothetical protein